MTDISKFGIPLAAEDNKSAADRCWETGDFTDDCICEFCDHKEECSGYSEED